MVALENARDIDYNAITIDDDWNDSDNTELIMHTIHSYPAKFPSFIASKAFEYAKEEGVHINKVADIFCGCGTVALEARSHNFDFWGCDINPVATLIARVKSCDYDIKKMGEFYSDIKEAVASIVLKDDVYVDANERLKYWFTENSYTSLLKLNMAIEGTVNIEKYKEAFECIFSSILKSCSRWLTKSIKPQVDPSKKEIDVNQCFDRQYRKFIRAINELVKSNSSVQIECKNFLECEGISQIDLIITSPPYVTSYEYADLHQLSSLWLKYTDDYRELRKGTIGSIYFSTESDIDIEGLNNTGKEIVESLMKTKCPKSKVRSIARYYLDMQSAVKKCSTMLSENGMIFFVIGDTEYKGVRILNSKHLIETMFEEGFSDIKIGKRTISKGICVPFRDDNGKFSKDKSKKQIYHEEFIISGRYKG